MSAQDDADGDLAKAKARADLEKIIVDRRVAEMQLTPAFQRRENWKAFAGLGGVVSGIAAAAALFLSSYEWAVQQSAQRASEASQRYQQALVLSSDALAVKRLSGITLLGSMLSDETYEDRALVALSNVLVLEDDATVRGAIVEAFKNAVARLGAATWHARPRPFLADREEPHPRSHGRALRIARRRFAGDRATAKRRRKPPSPRRHEASPTRSWRSSRTAAPQRTFPGSFARTAPSRRARTTASTSAARSCTEPRFMVRRCATPTSRMPTSRAPTSAVSTCGARASTRPATGSTATSGRSPSRRRTSSAPTCAARRSRAFRSPAISDTTITSCSSTNRSRCFAAQTSKTRISATRRYLVLSDAPFPTMHRRMPPRDGTAPSCTSMFSRSAAHAGQDDAEHELGLSMAYTNWGAAKTDPDLSTASRQAVSRSRSRRNTSARRWRPGRPERIGAPAKEALACGEGLFIASGENRGYAVVAVGRMRLGSTLTPGPIEDVSVIDRR